MKFKVFYISDLHYSKHAQPANTGSLPSQGPTGVAPSAAPLSIFSWFKSYLTSNKKLLKKEFEGIFFFVTGDLTDRGKAEGLKKCESFLIDCCSILELPTTNIIIAPGNHDIERVGSSEQQWKNFISHTTKFTTPFNATNHFANDTMIVIPVNSINLDKRVKSKGWFRTEHELVEVPVVDNAHIERFNEICNSKTAKLKIVLLHSHLLPVYMIDERPYDIITNAGIFIKELQKQTVSLILHGHKHTYSAKVIQDFEARDNPVPMIVIGSKEFSVNGGFSELEIDVTSGSIDSIIFSRKVFENGDVKDSGKISDLVKYLRPRDLGSPVVTANVIIPGGK